MAYMYMKVWEQHDPNSAHYNQTFFISNKLSSTLSWRCYLQFDILYVTGRSPARPMHKPDWPVYFSQIFRPARPICANHRRRFNPKSCRLKVIAARWVENRYAEQRRRASKPTASFSAHGVGLYSWSVPFVLRRCCLSARKISFAVQLTVVELFWHETWDMNDGARRFGSRMDDFWMLTLFLWLWLFIVVFACGRCGGSVQFTVVCGWLYKLQTQTSRSYWKTLRIS